MKNGIKTFEISKLEQFEVSYKDYIGKELSDRTLDTYETGLREFAKYMAENGITSPTRKDILEYKEYLIEKDLKPATINTYLIALRTFFDYLINQNIITDNITENVRNVTDTDIHKREALNEEQCQECINNTKDLREKALFVLILTCGLRVNEVANIRLQDFTNENGVDVLHILGKGRDSKHDIVVLDENVKKILTDYVEKYEIKDYLFVSTSNNNTNNRLSNCSIRRIINGIFERTGIKKDTITCHSLRHSFATISIKNGVGIREVSQALRHKSVTTTERYLHDLEIENNKCSSTVGNLFSF